MGWVPEDDAIRLHDIEGKSLLEIINSPTIDAVKRCLAEMGILIP